MDRSTMRIRLGWLVIPVLGLVTACGGAATPTVTDHATASTTTAPETPGGSGAAIQHVALTIATGHDVTVDIDDASGRVHDATSGTPGDGASVEPYRLVVSNDDPTTLRLTWSGGPCDLADSLVIDDTAREFLLVEPECPGDAIAFDRVLLLHLSSPIDAADVHAVLQDGLDTDG